ncbi:Formyl-CoA transferase [Burkholderia sp. lig30]|uniref:CaiB/BaiF CoA transferase family protein n=1 Tax=Burkholderia sp. lig30 TaxID=1192124 RepID=UPI000461897E|nr:CoA transferase [Burkholderia sp. lig30]KDB09011.1 Formyl-CoA transferase [Burkholderia sp. lig30]
MQEDQRALPLSGVKVLDFSRVLAGPWCAMVLADFGAEVVKVEHPARGDDTRDWGLRIGDTETTYFNSVNRSKRSICVDLQTDAGQRVARELAARADVVIHNFKPGGAEKLGLGYDALAALNPRLVHCAISGYDRSGPEAGRPGYDLVVQGEAGLMALNGEEDQPPLKFGVAAVDLFTGMYSAQAILAALYERHTTGRGRRIEMALFDCGLMITAYYGLEALLMEKDPPRYGNAHPSIVPYGVFDAKDGPLVITVGNNAQFARFCGVIGRLELAQDARFATNLARSANRAELLPDIRRALASRPRAALLAALADAGIPCGEVLGLHEALTSERARGAGLVTRQPHPVAGGVDVLVPPYRIDGERLPVRGAPPVLGADTARVLGEWLGLSGADVERLRTGRAV